MDINWKEIVSNIAPTVATALGGPLAGIAVKELGNVLGISEATQDSIKQAITGTQLTPEAISKLKELELQYQENERERGFKYAELSFKDRDSARTNNTAGGIQGKLFWMSCLILLVTLSTEIGVLFLGLPPGTNELVIGRVLGLMDSVAMMVLAYYYGSSSGSDMKTQHMLANSETKKEA